jgi:Na+-driven multidrug efflux pump
MTVHGFIIFSFAFLTMGLNIFGSAFFTALNNGAVSALISFLRNLVFLCASVIVLPIFFGLDGVWYSLIVGDVLSVIVTVICLVLLRKRYEYV